MIKNGLIGLIHLYLTGHSKGGHEAQICAANMIPQAGAFPFPIHSVSFNAPGVHTRNGTDCNYHTNIRIAGKLWRDVVSKMGGSQLGRENITLDRPLSIHPRMVHSMSSVMMALSNNQHIAQKKVILLWKHVVDDGVGIALDVEKNLSAKPKMRSGS